MKSEQISMFDSGGEPNALHAQDVAILKAPKAWLRAAVDGSQSHTNGRCPGQALNFLDDLKGLAGDSVTGQSTIAQLSVALQSEHGRLMVARDLPAARLIAEKTLWVMLSLFGSDSPEVVVWKTILGQTLVAEEDV